MVEDANRVASLAHRLRLIQADRADADPAARRQRLSDEIARALEAVEPRDRQAFLAALMERFPTWDPMEDVPAEAEHHPSPSRSEVDEHELRDPDFLVSRLVALLPGLGESRKNGIARDLRQAGLNLSEPAGWPVKLEEQFRRQVLEGCRGPISPARVLESLRVLLDFVCTLDPIVWHTWQAVASKAETKPAFRQPSGSVRTTFTRFLQEDDTLAATQPREDLERLRRVVAALVCAIARGSQHFASRYWSELAPGAIERLVETETTFVWLKERACWRKYCQVARHLDEAGMEDEVVRAIAECAISLVDGLSR